jgi:hypothetical protein
MFELFCNTQHLYLVVIMNFFILKQDEEHIKNVTQQFCDWVASLGGDSNNIEESTITSLFASGYETKPNLSVPIHVVELASVPQELRMSENTGPSNPQHTDADSKPVCVEKQSSRVSRGSTMCDKNNCCNCPIMFFMSSHFHFHQLD